MKYLQGTDIRVVSYDTATSITCDVTPTWDEHAQKNTFIPTREKQSE